jgi:predicted MFS family arabinose efflux permease
MLTALMNTLVIPLLPDFPGILVVTTDDASWMVTATLLSSAVATPIVSRCADVYRKRKMMVVCHGHHGSRVCIGGCWRHLPVITALPGAI